jgi:hypothetical protein
MPAVHAAAFLPLLIAPTQKHLASGLDSAPRCPAAPGEDGRARQRHASANQHRLTHGFKIREGLHRRSPVGRARGSPSERHLSRNLTLFDSGISKQHPNTPTRWLHIHF